MSIVPVLPLGKSSDPLHSNGSPVIRGSSLETTTAFLCHGSTNSSGPRTGIWFIHTQNQRISMNLVVGIHGDNGVEVIELQNFRLFGGCRNEMGGISGGS